MNGSSPEVGWFVISNNDRLSGRKVGSKRVHVNAGAQPIPPDPLRARVRVADTPWPTASADRQGTARQSLAPWNSVQ